MLFPKGASVNDGISHENSTVCYATIGDAIRCMKLAGRGCFLAKTDIKNAFRIIPIQSDDYGLLGMHWKGYFYFDLWAVQVLVEHLKFLALQLNGLPGTS